MKLRTSAERALANALLKLPRRAMVRLSGGKRIRVDAEPLDEQVQLVLATAKLLGKKGPEHAGVARARADMDESAKILDVDPRPMASVVDHDVGRFRMRVYRPSGIGDHAPALLYIHGGGFVCGSLDSHDGVCRYFAAEVPCVVAALDYRLAPEHPFPAAVEDAIDALAWVRKLDGIDPGRVAIGGDSAGGNLSAVVCQQVKDKPRFQLLIYPATDMTRSMKSHELFAKGFYLEKTSIDFYLEHYLGTHDPRDPRASPWFGDVSGVPPAFVVTAGFDPLRDEGKAYADKMRAAGVPVEYRNDAGMFHGYFACGRLDVAADALAHSARALRAALP